MTGGPWTRSMDPVHESGSWTQSKVGVHGPLVHVLSSPRKFNGLRAVATVTKNDVRVYSKYLVLRVKITRTVVLLFHSGS